MVCADHASELAKQIAELEARNQVLVKDLETALSDQCVERDRESSGDYLFCALFA